MDATTFKIKTPCLTGGEVILRLLELTLPRSALTIMPPDEKTRFIPTREKITRSWFWMARQLFTIRPGMPKFF